MSKSIFKNSIYKFILNGFNVIVPLVATPYVSSLLTPDGFGTYNTANAMMSFFLVFSVFGIYNYGVREISKVRDDKKKLESLFTNLFVFSIATSLITSLIYFLYVTFAVNSSQQGSYYIMLIQLAGNIVSIEWINEAVENYGFITKKTILVRTLYVIAIFVFVRNPEDIIPYGFIMSLTVFINNLASFFYIKRKVRFRFSDFKPGRYFGPLLILLLISNINILYAQLDKIFLGNFVSGIRNTEYTLPCNIINMAGAMITSLLLVSVPRLSYYFSNGQRKDYMELLNKSTRSFFLILCPFCIGLFCLSYEAMFLYTRDTYTYAYPVMMVSSIQFLINSIYAIFTSQILYILGRERKVMKIILFGGILNLVFNLILLWGHAQGYGWLNPLSAVITTAIAETVMLAIMYWYIRVKVKVPFKLFSFQNMKYLLFTLPFLPITWAVKTIFPWFGVIQNCLVIIPLCSIVYLVILVLNQDPVLAYLLRRVAGRFKRKRS